MTWLKARRASLLYTMTSSIQSSRPLVVTSAACLISFTRVQLTTCMS